MMKPSNACIHGKGTSMVSQRGIHSRVVRPSSKVCAHYDFGVHGMVYSGGWSEEECAAAVTGAVAAGYDMLEVPLLNPDAIDTEMTLQQLKFNELHVSTSLALPHDADINSEDPEMVQRGVDFLMKALKKTHELEAKHMVGVLTSAIKKYPGRCTPAARANVVKSIKEVAKQAAEWKIMLGLEVVNRYETNVMNTAAEAMVLLQEIDEPNVRIHLDTYHMNIEEVSMASAVSACGDKLGYVHIGESHRGYLGTGSVDFRGLFRALVDTGYSGPLTFESFSSNISPMEVTDTLAVWRDLWSNSDDLAAHARMFIQSELTAAEQSSQAK